MLAEGLREPWRYAYRLPWRLRSERQLKTASAQSNALGFDVEYLYAKAEPKRRVLRSGIAARRTLVKAQGTNRQGFVQKDDGSFQPCKFSADKLSLQLPESSEKEVINVEIGDITDDSKVVEHIARPVSNPGALPSSPRVEVAEVRKLQNRSNNSCPVPVQPDCQQSYSPPNSPTPLPCLGSPLKTFIARSPARKRHCVNENLNAVGLGSQNLAKIAVRSSPTKKAVQYLNSLQKRREKNRLRALAPKPRGFQAGLLEEAKCKRPGRPSLSSKTVTTDQNRNPNLEPKASTSGASEKGEAVADASPRTEDSTKKKKRTKLQKQYDGAKAMLESSGSQMVRLRLRLMLHILCIFFGCLGAERSVSGVPERRPEQSVHGCIQTAAVVQIGSGRKGS